MQLVGKPWKSSAIRYKPTPDRQDQQGADV
jgi:hypothetical protein